MWESGMMEAVAAEGGSDAAGPHGNRDMGMHGELGMDVGLKVRARNATCGVPIAAIGGTEGPGRALGVVVDDVKGKGDGMQRMRRLRPGASGKAAT